MVEAGERKAFARPSADFDDFGLPSDDEELISLAGPGARFVAAARRRKATGKVTTVLKDLPKEPREEVLPEPLKELQVEQEAKAAKPERKSWADMMEDDDIFDWPEDPKKTTGNKSTGYEKWSWSTAATDQDFDDLMEALPEDLEQEHRKKQDLEQQRVREQLEKERQLLEEIRKEHLRKEQELLKERQHLEELKREQMRQLEQQKREEMQRLQQEQLRQQQMQQEQLRQQQLQQEQLRQQQIQKEKLLQQQMQQEQMRQQQMQQEQLRQQQMQQMQQRQQEQLRQQQMQQMQQEQMRQQQMQQMQQEQIRQQQMQAQQLQMQQMQMQGQLGGQVQVVPVMVQMIGQEANRSASTTASEKDESEEKLAVVPVSSSGQGPIFGSQHHFHQKNVTMGVLSADARTFTKNANKGRLSIVCENRVHFKGVVRYAVQFTEGELCSADGVGFILSSDLPCTKNIQRIISVFANRTGRICVRVHEEVERCKQRVKCLELGDWLEVISDLDQQTVTFVVWPQDESPPTWATVSFGDVLDKARSRISSLPRSPCGYLAVVMKHMGVSVRLGS
eukprot:CAMPEP_0181423834 /NCGR_PEP_ID=MMETSP1110-20121109/14332_1 /TAXON_ID=174948 /ORGANISM="Symbiodinium sp., Strain CCMP421" /LENGTH=562 /DNA_ID=CAMNT_0023546971 /DNA_START=51 /DNA_END=1739 /DNA_ORIENTATION=-